MEPDEFTHDVLSVGERLAAEALIVWEESTAPLPPQGFALLDQRKYGDTIITILRAPE